jgi:hypothetical protein
MNDTIERHSGVFLAGIYALDTGLRRYDEHPLIVKFTVSQVPCVY